MLVNCINSRDFSKWAMIMGTIETDWLKVQKNPETFQASLDQLVESKENGEAMNTNFFR